MGWADCEERCGLRSFELDDATGQEAEARMSVRHGAIGAWNPPERCAAADRALSIGNPGDGLEVDGRAFLSRAVGRLVVLIFTEFDLTDWADGGWARQLPVRGEKMSF